MVFRTLKKLEGIKEMIKTKDMEQLKKEYNKLLTKVLDEAVEIIPKDKHWSVGQAIISDDIWQWITTNFTPKTTATKEKEEWLGLFKEGHKYSAWVEEGKLFVADDANFTLEQYKNDRGKV